MLKLDHEDQGAKLRDLQIVQWKEEVLSIKKKADLEAVLDEKEDLERLISSLNQAIEGLKVNISSKNETISNLIAEKEVLRMKIDGLMSEFVVKIGDNVKQKQMLEDILKVMKINFRKNDDEKVGVRMNSRNDDDEQNVENKEIILNNENKNEVEDSTEISKKPILSEKQNFIGTKQDLMDAKNDISFSDLAKADEDKRVVDDAQDTPKVRIPRKKLDKKADKTPSNSIIRTVENLPPDHKTMMDILLKSIDFEHPRKIVLKGVCDKIVSADIGIDNPKSARYRLRTNIIPSLLHLSELSCEEKIIVYFATATPVNFLMTQMLSNAGHFEMKENVIKSFQNDNIVLK